MEAEGSSLTPNTRKRASKRGTTVVDTQVRRSTRLKDANKGFKSNDYIDKKNVWPMHQTLLLLKMK